MKPTLLLASLMLITSLASAGCFNFAAFQGAEVLDRGESSKGMGLTVNSYPVNDDDSQYIPAVNAWYRRGLTDNVEAHVLAWMPLGATLGVKYRLAGERHRTGLSVAAGIDFGYMSVTTGQGHAELSDTFFDTYVPLYLGYRASEALSVYAVPKYVLRYTSPSDEASSISHVIGTALGVGIGASSTLHLEAAVLYSMDDGTSVNGAIGYAF